MGRLEDLRKRRGQGDGKSPDSGLWAYVDDAIERFPTLYAMLAQQKVDGKVRETATMIVFCEGGRLKFTINDRDDHMIGFGTASSLETILDDVETCLSEDKIDWRPQKNGR